MARVHRSRWKVGDIDQARLLPHLRDRAVAGAPVVPAAVPIVIEQLDAVVMAGSLPTGDDNERLRGLPMIAPGVTGAIRGTSPHRDALRRLR